jgi:hypothetical protein
MRRCPRRGFCLASRRTSSRVSSRVGGRQGGVRVGPCVLDQAQVPGEQGAGRRDPAGPRTGPPLLLCNGIGMRLEALQPFVDALDPAIEVIRPSLLTPLITGFLAS